LTTGQGAGLTLRGEILSLDGQTTFRAEASGSDAQALGEKLGQALLDQAGPDWLKQWMA
jgi:hydroxymethylbilane synthase